MFLVECCDPFNDKALKAGRAAAFKVPICVMGSWQHLEQVITDHGLQAFGAVPTGSAGPQIASEKDSPFSRDQQPGRCLMLGSEGQGLCQAALDLCRPLTIPMSGDMESFNVAQAGAMLMFAMSSSIESVMTQLKH